MNDFKSKKPVRIGKIIDTIFADHKKLKQTAQAKIIENWAEIIPEDNAGDSKPVMIKNKVLIIEVSNSALLHHLVLRKNDIMNRIKTRVSEEEIKDIRFKIGNSDAF